MHAMKLPSEYSRYSESGPSPIRPPTSIEQDGDSCEASSCLATSARQLCTASPTSCATRNMLDMPPTVRG